MSTKSCLALLIILASPAASQVFKTGLLVVSDGNDQIVGSVVNAEGNVGRQINTAVFVNDMPHFLLLDFSNPALLLPPFQNGAGVSFTTADCSGMAYLNRVNPTFSLHPPSFPVNNPGLTLYVRAPNVVAQQLVIQSELTVTSGCAPVPSLTRSVLETVAIDTGFVPPYRLTRGPDLDIVGAGMAFSVQAIPTLGTWGLLCLVLLVIAAALVLLLKNQSLRPRSEGRAE